MNTFTIGSNYYANFNGGKNFIIQDAYLPYTNIEDDSTKPL